MVDIIDKIAENRFEKDTYNNLIEITRDYVGKRYGFDTDLRPLHFKITKRKLMDYFTLPTEKEGIHVYVNSRKVESNSRNLDCLAIELANLYEEKTNIGFVFVKK